MINISSTKLPIAPLMQKCYISDLYNILRGDSKSDTVGV